MNAIVFVLCLIVGLVAANLITYYFVMKMVMNPKFIKKYSKMSANVAMEVAEDMFKNVEEA